MGTFTNIEKVSKLIKNEISNIKLPFKKVAYTVQNEYIINRNIKIINTNHKEDIKGLIKYELNQYMPINIDDYILKYRFLGIENDKINIQVILMPKSIAQNYKELSTALKLKPIKLGVNFNILQTLIDKKLISINDDKNTILDIKKSITNINILNRKNIISSHTVSNENVLNFINKNISDLNNIYYYGTNNYEFINLLQKEVKMNKLSLNNIIDLKFNNSNDFIENIGLVY
ncbi:MAG: pilus assembly protein PilM [Romboutsia sp.]